MLSVFLRAVVFGLGVEIGREIYRKVKEQAVGAPTIASPPITQTDESSSQPETIEGSPKEKKKKEE